MEALLLTLAASPWVYPALWLFATIDGFFPPIPSETAVIALAALGGAGGVPSVPLVILAAAVGAFTGDQVAYTIGALLDVRRLPYLHRPRPQAMLAWAERALSERGSSFILAARYIPVGRVAVNMTAGALRFPRRRFVGLTAIGAVVWALYGTVIGLAAGTWLASRPLIGVVVGVVVGALLGTAVDTVLSRRFHVPAPDLADGAAVVPDGREKAAAGGDGPAVPGGAPHGAVGEAAGTDTAPSAAGGEHPAAGGSPAEVGISPVVAGDVGGSRGEDHPHDPDPAGAPHR